MPHIPGHNRPFTSFLTQGMQNTNRNINTMNQPGFGQNIMGQQGRGFYESIGGGIGEPGGSTGPGGLYTPGFGMGTINPADQEGEGYISPFSKDPYYRNLLADDLSQMDFSPISGQSTPKGPPGGEGFYIQPPEGAGAGIVDINPGGDFFVGGGGQVGMDSLNPDIKDDFMMGQEQGMPNEQPPPGFQWQFINNEWIPIPESDYTYDPETGGFVPVGEDPRVPIPGGGFAPDQPELGNQVDLPNYLQEQQDPIDYGGLTNMYLAKPYLQDTYGEGWEWQFDEATGEWSQQFTDPGNFSIDFTSGLSLGDLPHSQNIHHNTYGQTSVWDTGLGGMTENIGQNLEEYEYQQMVEQYLETDPLQLNLGGLNLGGAFNTGLGNLTGNLGLQLATGAAPEFTGGGGQGGQQARRLYYPGTSGGFAGVGSGIKPGSFQDLLSRR